MAEQKKRNGVILAAGASQRMGSPKALLQLPDGTLLAEAQRRLLLEGGCDDVFTVIGHLAADIEPHLSGKIVIHSDWVQGRLSSVQAGLKACPHSDAIILLPVDAVGIQASTVSHLLKHSSPQPFTRPTFKHTPGHVLKISPEGRDTLLALPSSNNPNMGAQIRPMTEMIDCDDPAILSNVNTPEEWDLWVSKQ